MVTASAIAVCPMVSSHPRHRRRRLSPWLDVAAAFGTVMLALSSLPLTMRGLPRAYSAPFSEPVEQMAPTPLIPEGVDENEFHERLAQRVKKLQRSSPTAFRRWKRVCKEAGYMGKFNPHKHTVEFLQHYLNGDFSEDDDDDDVGDEEERPRASPRTLRALIYLFKRNPVYRWHWAQHCSRRSDWSLDPKMHDEYSIKSFMEEYQGAGKKAGDLTQKIAAEERVKALRRTPEGEAQWRKYIQKEGFGLKDPRCYPLPSLEMFLEKVNF